MSIIRSRFENRLKKKKRIRSLISGTAMRPRVSVFKSSKHIYAQAIDDVNHSTICSFSSVDKSLGSDDKLKLNKMEVSELVGKKMTEKLLSKGVRSVVFDRNGFLYHGRIKKLANTIREGGIKF